MLLERIARLAEEPNPLRWAELPVPTPAPDEVLIKVSACGVCHTELDEIEGRTPPPALPVVPGHQAVGRVVEVGANVSLVQLHERVGVGWIHRSTGEDDENLSDQFCATGRDVNGGYAEFMTVPERYAFPIPERFSDCEAAPLLCAGGVGYRALRLCGLRNGDRLGLTGFGGSNHLVLQLTRAMYPDSPVYVFARNPTEREFARQLGAAWAGDTEDIPPHAPHAIIDTTPAWQPVLAALARLRRGGRLVINAIRKESGDAHLLAGIDYERHLWFEKELKSVANVTGRDIREFLEVAARAAIQPEVQLYELHQANTALSDLRRAHVRGSKVLAIDLESSTLEQGAPKAAVPDASSPAPRSGLQ